MSNLRDLTVDNTGIMHKYIEYTEPISHEPREKQTLGKRFSFDMSEDKQEKEGQQGPSKETRFTVGSFLKENMPQQRKCTFELLTNTEYRVNRLEKAANEIITGLMTLDELTDRYHVEYLDPKPIQSIPSVPVQPIPAQQPKPIPTPGIFTAKEQTPKEKIGIKLGNVGADKTENPILPGLKPPAPAQPSMPKSSTSEKPPISTPTEQTRPKNLMPGIEGGIFPQPSQAKPTRSEIMQENMESELPIEGSGRTPMGPTISLGGGGTLFHNASFGDPSSERNQRPTNADRRSSESQPRGQTPERNLKNTEMKANLQLYLELSKKANQAIREQTVVTKEKMAIIKDIVQDFFSKLCSSVDDYFLNSCQNIIDELDRRKSCEEEYLAFVFEFVTKFILDYLKLMSNNKIKIVVLPYR